MFDDIVQDWERWVASPRARRKLGDWGRRHPATDGWGAGELRSPTSSERTDALQAALVALAQAGDGDAARTLIVQMRPGLVGLAWRGGGWHPGGSQREVEREVLSAFGETLSSHRLDRRPARIAANLLLDTRQRLWRASQRERRLAAAGWGANEPPEHHRPGAIDGTLDGTLDLVAAIESTLADLAAAPDGRRLTAELAYRAWILDEPSVAIARELGLRRNTVDTRLCRLRSTLRTTRVPDDVHRVTRRSDGSAPPSSPVGPSCVSRQ